MVFDRRCRGDEIEAEFALEPLLDDLHVKEAQEAAAEPEAERDRALGRIGEARVVEMQLLERVTEQRIVLATDRVDAREHEAIRLLVAREGFVRRPRHGRDGVADLGVADALEPGRDIADLARDQVPDGHELRPEDAELERVGLGATPHQTDRVAVTDRPLGEADVDDHALVRVVVAVEDQGLQRFRGVALGRRDPRDDRLEDVADAGTVLRRREDDLLARDRQDVLQLVHDRVRVRRRQVDLVEDRDERQVLAQREMDVGQRLSLDALRCINDQDGTLAGLE